MKRPLFLSLRTRILIGFTLLFATLFAAASYWGYRLETEDMLRGLSQDLEATIRGAARGLKGDDFLPLRDTGVRNAKGFSSDPRYVAQMNWFETVRNIEPRARPYTYVPDKAGDTVVFLTDLWAWHNPQRAAKFLQRHVPDSAMRRGLRTMKIQLTPITDQWGSWISAYMPVHDSRGKPVAALGMDFDVTKIMEVQALILRRVLLCFLITYVVGCALVYILSGYFSRPLVELATMAEGIGEGEYELHCVPWTKARIHDEITTLAQVLVTMGRNIHHREQTLVSQVQQLRIEVDEAKKRRQVEEITDTEYFHDLQGKARQLRERRGQ